MKLDRYVGIPFMDGGRDFDGADCWGLVRLYLANEAQLADLPQYSETPAHDLAGVARDLSAAAVSPTWSKIERREARAFDVVLLTAFTHEAGRLTNVVGHVGVLTAREQILHIEEVISSVIIRLDHPSIRHRLVGFYRHKSLA